MVTTIKFSKRMANLVQGPPWSLLDCSLYLFYVCPESDCTFKNQNEDLFVHHMSSNHDILHLNGDSLLKTKNLNNIVLGKEGQNPAKRPRKSGVTFNCLKCSSVFQNVVDLKRHADEIHAKVVQKTEDFDDNFLEDLPDLGNNSDKELDNLDEDSFKDFKPVPIITVEEEDKKAANRILTKLRCQHCFEDLTSFYYLKSHHDKCRGKLPIKFTKRTVQISNHTEVLIKEIDGKSSTFKCDHCDYVSSHDDLRGLHMIREHNDYSKVVVFKCDKCDFDCKSRRAMAKHKKDHENGKASPKKRITNAR